MLFARKEFVIVVVCKPQPRREDDHETTRQDRIECIEKYVRSRVAKVVPSQNVGAVDRSEAQQRYLCIQHLIGEDLGSKDFVDAKVEKYAARILNRSEQCVCNGSFPPKVF